MSSSYGETGEFLKEKMDTDTYFWCYKRRQIREHLFKERTAWEREIHATGWWGGNVKQIRVEGGGDPLEGEEGFGFCAQCAKARLSVPRYESCWRMRP